jgi:hypothetical protein
MLESFGRIELPFVSLMKKSKGWLSLTNISPLRMFFEILAPFDLFTVFNLLSMGMRRKGHPGRLTLLAPLRLSVFSYLVLRFIPF